MNDWIGMLNVAFSLSENSQALKPNDNVPIITNTNLPSWDLCTVRRDHISVCFFGM